ncbi:MAG TPA: polyphosphate kinase 1 [Pyrinomonadaceae bacterium]
MSTALKNESPSRTVQTVTARLPALHPKAVGATRLFFNRELSLLEFHRRVLEEGLDATNPLLERLKFLGIFSSNLDEFFMIRVSGLKEELEENVTELSPDGMTPEEQLKEIRRRVLAMIEQQTQCLKQEILPGLAAENIRLVSHDSLPPAEQETLRDYFHQKVFPVLTPLAVDPSHPFPYISPLSLNLGLMVQAPDGKSVADPKQKHVPRFVRIKVPPVVPRLVPVGKLGSRFVLLEDLIEANIDSLFPGMITEKCHRFRVTRDADIEIREDEAEDLLRLIQEELRQRRFGTPVRLELSAGMPQEMIDYLTESLGLSHQDVYVVDGPLGLQDLSALADLNRPDLKYPSFTPAMPEWLGKRSLFDVISEQDILLHHPFDAYNTVTDFINEAVDDDDVVAIKICLYRTGPESPIPPALIRAAEIGKQVTALIEIKARFDEEHNIEWANKLDEAGVHVVYGVLGLKTHGKLTLVVRREGTSLKRYVHVASGNYNPTTSCFYTDVGLFTCDESVGADATEMFNYLTGWSRQVDYRKLLVAPVNLKNQTSDLIDREIQHCQQGRPAHIIAKFNRLADKDIIEKLYDASKAGVKIDLIVRGVCMLRPGVPGLSENITVRNVIGRFLEHSRVFYFANGGDDEVYIGSADWMSRNLKHRIEVVAPVSDPSLRHYLKDVLLAAYLRDNVKARQLTPDGSYARIEREPGGRPFDSQQFFINHETALS